MGACHCRLFDDLFFAGEFVIIAPNIPGGLGFSSITPNSAGGP
jgi:hypothetical protein